MAGGDVEKNKLVGPLGLIPRSHRHGVTSIDEFEKLRSLDDPPLLHVEAGDDPLGQHHAFSPAVEKPVGTGSPTRPSSGLEAMA